MPKLSVPDKAKLLVSEGRVVPEGNAYRVQGDTGEYLIEKVKVRGEWRWTCPCDAGSFKAACSHKLAVEIYEEGEMTMLQVKQAVKAQKKARVAILGPSGSGKTFTALQIAKGLVGDEPIVVIDTEHGSASLYADRFNFGVIELDTFAPQMYVAALDVAAKCGAKCVVIDSLSHAWAGKGGALQMVDDASKRTKNSYASWGEVTPHHLAMIDAMLSCPCHIIVTMRVKTDYLMEKNESTGKTSVTKVGLAPVQRDGMEYEFDVIADMDLNHNFIVSKTRLNIMDQAVLLKPGPEVGQAILADLNAGAVAAPLAAQEPAPVPPVTPPPTPPPATARKAPVRAPAPAASGADFGPLGDPADQPNPFDASAPPPTTPQRLEQPVEQPVYDEAGRPANKAAEMFERVNGWEVVAKEMVVDGAVDPGLDEATEHAGALKTVLAPLGYAFGKAESLKAGVGYGEIAWPALTKEQRMVIVWEVERLQANLDSAAPATTGAREARP